jgi:D-3-phosphoglycerate dehydrogenase
MTLPKVLVALSTFAEYGQEPLDLLRKSGFSFVLNSSGQRLKEEEILVLAKDCDGIVAGVEPYTSQVLAELPQLKCISRCGVGTDNVDKLKAKELGIKICNTPDPVVQPVAELTVGMMLDLLRQITWHTNSMREQKWQKKGGRNLQGCVVGLVGLGRIGRKVAEILKSFDARIVGFDPHPDQSWAKVNGVELVSYDNLLQSADIVSLHLSIEKTSSFILGEKEIWMMKPGSILINVARGEFVDENALYKALYDGHLSGAGLDVFAKEPYAGKLCSLENILLTPHVATLTRESRLEMEKQAVENLLRALA